MSDLVYILRTCRYDMTSHGGFTWPESGPVEAPDWSPVRKCGQGLHGLPWGEGDASLLDWSDDARWLVVEVEAATVVDLDGKVKFPRGTVVHCGDRLSATADIIARGATGAVVGAVVTAGDRGTATAGDWGTATAGYRGTATAGYRGTATAGHESTATAGHESTATAGDWGTATAGDWGTATAGDRGTATAGDWGTATAGYRGTATAGYWGTATAGYRGTIILRRWDGVRYRTVVGYVGEDGIEPNVAYRLDDAGKFVRAKVAA
jgi:hypothetical protein